MEPYSEAIGKFVRDLDLAQVPPAVIDKAKLVFLDTLGIALASSTMDFGAMVLNVAKRLGGAAQSRLIGTAAKVDSANAVIANGTLAHGLDYDDTLEEAIVHTGCVAATTALAAGEEVRASGKAVYGALAHSAPVTDALYSPDGRWIVTNCVDARARLWKADRNPLTSTRYRQRL